MNKLNKIYILNQYVITFGALIFLLMLSLDLFIVANIIILITIGFIVYECINGFIYYFNRKKVYLNDRNKIINEKEINRIKNYKLNKINLLICNLITMPLVIVLMFMLYKNNKENIIEMTDNVYYAYFIFILLVGLMIYCLIKDINKIRVLKTIDNDLLNQNYETINNVVKEVKPLYYGYGRKSSLKEGYGFEFVFNNDLKVTVLVEFPFIGTYKVDKIIKEEFIGKSFKLTYLKESKLVIKNDEKIIKVLY